MLQRLCKLLLGACLVATSVGSGACGSDAPVEEVLRDDLVVTTYTTTIQNGLSGRVQIDIPFGVDSFLIEVKGKKGLYFLTEFITPSGQDLIESAKFVTRGAREIPGLVDWLYPNSPELRAEEGTYTLTVRGRDAFTGNNLANEEVQIKIYTPEVKPQETCGVHLDFLVDDAAIDLASFEGAVESIVQTVDRNFRQVGIKVADYQFYRVDMQSSDIDLGSNSAISVVDDVLDKTIPNGAARENAVHIMLVRRIGGSDNPTFDPAGYSMGLPGPFHANRGTAAVLVSTELYADFDGFLDADGLASSLTHEIGHYLGLYHTSERNGTNHDPIGDTPECDSEFTCSDQFRKNIMTSSFWLQGADPSTRNRFSEGQGRIMRGHPLCEPMSVNVLPPPIDECTLECTAPNTCAVVNSRMSCEQACDPNATSPCETGTCLSDDLGTFVCL